MLDSTPYRMGFCLIYFLYLSSMGLHISLPLWIPRRGYLQSSLPPIVDVILSCSYSQQHNRRFTSAHHVCLIVVPWNRRRNWKQSFTQSSWKRLLERLRSPNPIYKCKIGDRAGCLPPFTTGIEEPVAVLSLAIMQKSLVMGSCF